MTYVGGGSVAVVLDGVERLVATGDSIEVSDGQAARLLEQATNWAAVKPSAKAAPAASEE